tara:strand:+ start:142 stop:384 length:243 start_codon:yes stop_codon:yes gene_type:complete
MSHLLLIFFKALNFQLVIDLLLFILTVFRAGISYFLRRGRASISCCISSEGIIISHCFNFVFIAPATPVKKIASILSLLN